MPTRTPHSSSLPPKGRGGRKPAAEPVAVPATNLGAAQAGDHRRALEVLRDTLAAQLDTTEAQIHAQLAAQYRATLAELAALPVTNGKSARERLAERVAAANVVS